MKFRTEIEIPKFDYKIEYSDTLFFIGSCFATNMAQECSRRGLRVAVNPFGVTYNPLSVVSVLKYVCGCLSVDKQLFRKVGERWCSMMHHSSFDSDSIAELERRTMDATLEAHSMLKNSKYLFITLGTSWVYTDKGNGDVVNNCHKIADNEFVRRRLNVDEIVDNFSLLFDTEPLMADKRIVFTVSPIRHLKDTLAGNSLSKATLLTAVWMLCEKYPDRVSYFPSYEIMVDDLRDYRFYEADMVHPSGVAVKYIYSIFEEAIMAKRTLEYCRRMERIESARAHRVIDSGGVEHLKFKENMMSNVLQIRQDFPLVDYCELIDFFK